MLTAKRMQSHPPKWFTSMQEKIKEQKETFKVLASVHEAYIQEVFIAIKNCYKIMILFEIEYGITKDMRVIAKS